jgi:hypothetical protein
MATGTTAGTAETGWATQFGEWERRAAGLPKPAVIAIVVIAFLLWWPIGLAALAFMIWSRSMMCGPRSMDRWQDKMNRMQAKMDRMRGRMGEGGFWTPPSSGNKAFDDYRAETLRRLEDEQREFQDFLERLRFAKDKSEFDQFMAERRRSPDNSPPAPQS